MANTKSRMGYHALNSLEIWDRMAIVFDGWKDTLMYTVYMVVLNQNTPVIGKTLFWDPGWRTEGGWTTIF